jgi:hypothetical protein
MRALSADERRTLWQTMPERDFTMLMWHHRGMPIAEIAARVRCPSDKTSQKLYLLALQAETIISQAARPLAAADPQPAAIVPAVVTETGARVRAPRRPSYRATANVGRKPAHLRYERDYQDAGGLLLSFIERQPSRVKAAEEFHSYVRLIGAPCAVIAVRALMVGLRMGPVNDILSLARAEQTDREVSS